MNYFIFLGFVFVEFFLLGDSMFGKLFQANPRLFTTKSKSLKFQSDSCGGNIPYLSLTCDLQVVDSHGDRFRPQFLGYLEPLPKWPTFMVYNKSGNSWMYHYQRTPMGYPEKMPYISGYVWAIFIPKNP